MLWPVALLAALWAAPPSHVHDVEVAAATTLYYDINKERRSHGLAPLRLDARLSRAAIEHVVDMRANNYFDHASASGESPFDRMRKAGCAYRYAGENLAQAPSAHIADSALFASAPHRENTLFANYRRVGIAVISDGSGGLLFVEDFSD